MHPALFSWREQLPAIFVRWFAYLCGIVALSITAAHVFRAHLAVPTGEPRPPASWITIQKPFPAFALSIPEAAGVPARYIVRYNRNGVGRKDIMTLGRSDSADPYLRVEIYRPGDELAHFAVPAVTIAAEAADVDPVNLRQSPQPLASKFGPLTILTFDPSRGIARHCLAFVRDYDDPRLQISGRFCRGGELVERAKLACALDRLTLLSAGSDAKVGKLFAKAELHRSFCSERDPLLTATPKYKVLWRALKTRPEPRQIGP